MSREVQEKAAPAASDAADKPKAATKPAARKTEKNAVSTASKKTPAATKGAAKKAPVKKALAKNAPTKNASAKNASAKKAPAKNAVTKKAVSPAQAPAKPVKQPAAPPAGKSAKRAAKPAAKEKVKKAKLVRDSFTMPEGEYQVLNDVKKAFLKIGMSVKKSELLRAGVALIKAMETSRLKTVIADLPPIKAGRPKKDK